MGRSRFSNWIIYKYELDAEINEGLALYLFNNLRGAFYRLVMRIAHKYHWHFAPPIYPDGDTQLWCQWCGFRQTIQRGPKMPYNNKIAGDGADSANKDKVTTRP